MIQDQVSDAVKAYLDAFPLATRPEWQGNEALQFWFFDRIHHPRALKPFEAIVPQAISLGVSIINSSVMRIPASRGNAVRIVDGYTYLGPVPRSALESAEQSFKFALLKSDALGRWDALYDQWKQQVGRLIDELEAMSAELAENPSEPADILEAAAAPRAIRVPEIYEGAITNHLKAWSLHFSLLVIGYDVYAEFIQEARRQFPDLSDSDVSAFLCGPEFLLYKPLRFIADLAQIATDEGIREVLLSCASFEEALAHLAATSTGARFRQTYHASPELMNFGSSTGFYSDEPRWRDQPQLPWSLLLHELRSGPVSATSDKVDGSAAFEQLIASIDDSEDVQRLRQLFQQARKVAPFIEDHSFYIEHWHQGCFWRLLRQLGGELVRAGLIAQADDVFWLNKGEVGDALMAAASASELKTINPQAVQKTLVELRKQGYAYCAAREARPTYGALPEGAADGLGKMLFGLGADSDKGLDENGVIRGIGAAKGAVEGKVVVASCADPLPVIHGGEILVCDSFPPAWIHLLPRVGAIVVEMGGVLSHCAIACREYGTPAVVGVAGARAHLGRHDRVHVDGAAGAISIGVAA